MPIPIEKINTHKAYTNGFITVGTQQPIYNENRRKVGTKFEQKFRPIPYNRATLTGQDLNILGAKYQQIKEKVSIHYNKQIEQYAETKLLVKIGEVLYNIEKTEKWQNELFLYLVTADEKGGNVHGL